MIYMLLMLIVVCLSIFIHELGHFIMAKWINCPVKDLSLGMGPILFSREKNGTTYNIRALLIGGFISIDPDDYEKLSKRHQFLVVIGGVTMNFLVAYLMIVTLIILKADVFWLYIPFYGINYLFELIGFYMTSVIEIFSSSAKEVLNSVAGPVGMLTMGENYFSHGITNSILNISLLNISLLVLNLLPLSPLDGFKIVKIISSKLKINPSTMNILEYLSLAIMGMFMLAVFAHDIVRIL